MLTAGGKLRLSRRYRWAKGQASVFPADQALAAKHLGITRWMLDRRRKPLAE